MRRHHTPVHKPPEEHTSSLDHAVSSHGPQISSSFLRGSTGLLDSLRIRPIANELRAKRALRTLVAQNSALQLVSLASLVGLEAYAADGRRSSSWSSVDLLFNACWLFPITLISIALNSSITGKCLNSNHGSSSAAAGISLRPFSISSSPAEFMQFLTAKLRSDSHRILIILNYFVMAKGLLYIPFLGFVFSFAFCSVANSFYFFDPSWQREGLSFEQRLDLSVLLPIPDTRHQEKYVTLNKINTSVYDSDWKPIGTITWDSDW